MAFKPMARKKAAPNSPEELFNDIPAKNIAGLFSQQADTLRSYFSNYNAKKDLALQLPTGSGKTLIGLLIAEWRRLKFQQKAIYLCPTRQLAYQVHSQAVEKYNIKSVVLCGKKKEFEQSDKIKYNSSDAVAITTYSSFFVAGTFFTDPETIILDDTHGAEHYIADQWSLLIERHDYATLYSSLLAIFREFLSTSDYRNFISTDSDYRDRAWIEKIPGPYLAQVHSELLGTLDESIRYEDDIKFTYDRIRNHLLACNCFISKYGILIRPLTAPTLTHTPFSNAEQRIYMSATLGEGGELERITGIRDIYRLPAPTGWDKHGTGRRFFVFPDLESTEHATNRFLNSLIPEYKKALVLTPSTKEVEKYSAVFKEYEIFYATDIEKSKELFIDNENAICILSNRYDGIDFKDDECRLLIIIGMNKASNLQEKFLTSRLGASTVYLDRIRTRVLQACGRCTRSPIDHSAIIVIGDELTSYFISKSNQKYLHPEYQAEIEFGIEQSRVPLQSIKDNLIHFLRQDDEWLEAESVIVDLKNDFIQEKLPAIDKLKSSVQHEIDFTYSIWNHNYEAALESCRKVISILEGDELRGYRAFWYYLQGCASVLGYLDGLKELEHAHRDLFKRAAHAAPSLRWLWNLARYGMEVDIDIDRENLDLIERLEVNLQNLKVANDIEFEKEIEFISTNLRSPDSSLFEQAHVKLGRLFGYDADNASSQSAPDPWWVASENLIFVFEDNSSAKSDKIGSTKVRQAASHPKWIRENKDTTGRATIISIMVSPCEKIEDDARAYAEDTRYINLTDFLSWADNGIAAIREIRRTFSSAGDEAWRANAMIQLEKASITPKLFLENIGFKMLRDL